MARKLAKHWAARRTEFCGRFYILADAAKAAGRTGEWLDFLARGEIAYYRMSRRISQLEAGVA